MTGLNAHDQRRRRDRGVPNANGDEAALVVIFIYQYMVVA